MANQDLSILTLEELKKKVKDGKKMMGFFIGIVIVYAVVVIISAIIKKKFDWSFAAILCLSIVLYAQNDTIKKLKQEISKRESLIK